MADLRDGLTYTPYSLLRHHIRVHRLDLALGLFSLLLVDLLQLLIPLIIKDAINFLANGSGPVYLLLRFSLIILGLALSIAAFRYLWRYFILGQSRRLERNLRALLYERVQSFPITFWDKVSIGDVMARATNDLNAIRMAAGMGLVALVDGVFLGICAIGFMISINPQLTLYSLLPMPLLAIGTKIITQKMARGYEASQASFSNLTEKVREFLTGIKVIKSFNREEWAVKGIEKASQDYMAKNLSLAKYVATFLPMTLTFSNLGLAIILGLGGRLTIAGSIDTGELVAFVAYLALLNWPIMAIGWVTNLVQRGKVSLERITRLLNNPPEVMDEGNALGTELDMGDIHIHGLTFKYPSSSFKLHIEKMEFPRGRTVAIVGKVGSGKTTLLNLITRLLEPPKDTVFLGDKDITSLPLKKYRSIFGFATQDITIFSTTVEKNISFGRENPAIPVMDLIELVGLYKELKADQDQIISEAGSNLSGGQKQRISLARALFLDPQVLILDDTLSMVDSKTEEEILNKLLRIRKGKTNIIVSHRISALSRADWIYVLENGSVIESGTHSDLLEKKGTYFYLYKRQLITKSNHAL